MPVAADVRVEKATDQQDSTMEEVSPALTRKSDISSGDAPVPRGDLPSKEPSSHDHSGHAFTKSDVSMIISQTAEDMVKEEDLVLHTDLCPERHVLVTNINRSKHRIFSKVIQEYAPMYSYAKRGLKSKIIGEVRKEMSRRGVIFLEQQFEFCPGSTICAFQPATNLYTINTLIQKQLRLGVHALSIGSTFGSGQSVSGTTISSNGSTIASHSSALSIILPAPPKAKEIAKMAPALEDHAATTATSSHSIMEISIEPPGDTGEKLHCAPVVAQNTFPFGDGHATEHDTSPPKLVGGLESWGSVNHEIISRESDCASKRTSHDDKGSEFKEPPQQRRRISPIHQPIAVGNEDGNADLRRLVESMSKRLEQVEARLESVERENRHMRVLLAKSKPRAPRDQSEVAKAVFADWRLEPL